MISIFSITGYYSDIARQYLPDWLAVGIFIAPLAIILFIQWGEVPDRVVAVSHIFAASVFMIFAVGMEIGNFIGYQPKGTELYRLAAHLGWSFAWAGVYRQARQASANAGNEARADVRDGEP